MKKHSCKQKIAEGSMSGDTLNILICVPRLEASNIEDLKKECEVFWNSEIKKLSIDMAGVQFIDSSGVGGLLSLYKKLPSQQSVVRLLSVHPRVREALELLRLHRIFEIS